jgi:hypothetical protein
MTLLLVGAGGLQEDDAWSRFGVPSHAHAYKQLPSHASDFRLPGAPRLLSELA